MRNTLPENGRKPAEVLEELKGFGAEDPDYRHSRVWSLVYYLDDNLEKFLAEAYQSYASANGLNPLAFKSLKKLESDIISITAGSVARSADRLRGGDLRWNRKLPSGRQNLSRHGASASPHHRT